MKDALRLASSTAHFAACEVVADTSSVEVGQLIEILADASSVDEFLTDMQSEGFLVRAREQLFPTRDFHLFVALIRGAVSRNPEKVLKAVEELYPELRRISVVKDNVTAEFFDAIRSEDSAGHISLCSPWINMTDHQFDGLRDLINRSVMLSQPYSVTVVMRPPRRRDPNRRRICKTVAAFESLGIDVIFSRRLHAKLYVRVPATSPGGEIAVIGSQNLTQSRYTELGLLIRDERRLVRELQDAFFDVARGAA